MKKRYPQKLPTFSLYSIESEYSISRKDEPEKSLSVMVKGLLEMMKEPDQWSFEAPNKYTHQTAVWVSPLSTGNEGSDCQGEMMLGFPGEEEIAVSFSAKYDTIRPMIDMIHHFAIERASKSIKKMAAVVELAKPYPQ